MDPGAVRLSDSELDFLVAAVAPEVRERSRLRQLIDGDDDFRQAFIGDEKAFHKVMADEEVFLKISPRLYFEILLRKGRRELEGAGHTIEREGTGKVAVFDTGEVAKFLSRREIIPYLADMLASFTKVESYAVSYRIREGIWRRITFSDLDLDSLVRLCESVAEEHRLGFFKRIGDICLFLLGLFPDYVHYTYRYPSSGETRPHIAGFMRRSAEEYREEGTKFYGLAAEHPAAREFALSDIFRLLHEKFRTALKPLNFIADHYLHSQRQNLFAVESR